MRGGDRLPLPANLTAGELRVLRYLSSNFSAPEIGAELYLSVNTVKTHMRHIYEKLGVRPLINARSFSTKAGGCALPREVLEAYRGAKRTIC